MCAPAAGCASAHRLERTAPVLIVGSASAFCGYHARTDWIARRTRSAEERAIGWLLDASNDRRTLAGSVFRHRLHLNGKAAFRVELPIGSFDAQSAVGQLAQAAPLEAGTEFKNFRDQSLRFGIAVASYAARELILDAAAARIQLLHQHADCLHHVERLEPGNHDRTLVLFSEIFIRSAANHRADMGRADEAIHANL